MKTIGIIGGMGWPSSGAYYQQINRLVGKKLGPQHCANLVLVQTDFEQIGTWQDEDLFEKLGKVLVSLSAQLKSAGADFIVIACNTAHKALPAVKDKIHLPVLHIVDITLEKVKRHGFQTVGLLGSVYTMTDQYFLGQMSRYGINAITPSKEEQIMMQDLLAQELVTGIFSEATRLKFRNIIDGLVAQGCEAVILGCTEFGTLLGANGPVPMIDTLVEHVEMAVELALQ